MNSVTRKEDLPAGERLKITEIFHSLQGEAVSVGIPTVFVRLTGCPLRCRYCDTSYAFFGGEWMSYDDILARVAGLGARFVCVTGGEPLAQKNCPGLLARLCDAGYAVSIETSGAFDVGNLDERVTIVMDVKTPASGEAQRNRAENLPMLRARDQVKFVICGREDYEWARDFVAHSETQAEVLFSPSYGQMQPVKLAEWILADKLPVRFQLQLHKLLWGEEAGH
ncbi:MAG: 7-carboxy-7-deazaguanine synthase QueE [Gammaproteobacteria bacterium]|nr:7-carboxy-7-deazaguanine synthase QueE [Gammaproteobacteria bacterium]